MATRRNSEEPVPSRRKPPATTPEQRENQLISKAYDLAEKQIDDGTASAQLLTHFVKLGSSREKLEQERLAMEVEFMAVKKETLASEQRTAELVDEALKAFVRYTGQKPDVEELDFED